MPPAGNAALVCLSFTNARVVSTIILFRCGCMAPTHSKRLDHRIESCRSSLSLRVCVDSTDDFKKPFSLTHVDERALADAS